MVEVVTRDIHMDGVELLAEASLNN